MNNVRSFFDRLRNSPILGGRRTEQILTEGSTSGLSSTIQERNVKSFLEDCFNQPTCISSRVSSYESNDAKFALPDPSSAILYNDLRYDKFYFEDELLDFDYPTTQEVVKNLARMHATSVAFRLLEPERFNEEVLSVLELKERDYVVKPTFPVHLNRKLLKFCLKDSFFNIDVILADIAQYSILNWYSTISEDQEWMALCHSQYWIPNILVKRNRKRQAIANILRMYVKTFEWVLAIHSVPDIICAAYIYEEFLKEFDVQGPKIIYNLLTDLLQVTCDEYTEGGLPILNARYKEKRTPCTLRLKKAHIHDQTHGEVKRRRLLSYIEALFDETIEVISEEVKPRSLPRNNPYIFDLNLVVRTASGHEENFNWIVKALQEDPKATITTRYDVQARMTKEIQLVEHFIDAVTGYQSSIINLTTTYESLFPKMYGCGTSGKKGHKEADQFSVLIYENLDSLGYNFEDPCRGFDMPTVEVAVKNLAYLHAVPIAMRLKNTFKFKERCLHLFNEIPDGSTVKDYHKEIYRKMRIGLDKHRELEEHRPKIETWIQISQRYSWTVKLFDSLDWFTVCHPRYSIRNIMVLRVLQCHEVELKDIEIFTFSSFIKEFNTMGPYMLANILYTLRTIVYSNIDDNGEPVLENAYQEKFKKIIQNFIGRQWIRDLVPDRKSSSPPQAPGGPPPPGDQQPPGEPKPPGVPQHPAEPQLPAALQPSGEKPTSAASKSKTPKTPKSATTGALTTSSPATNVPPTKSPATGAPSSTVLTRRDSKKDKNKGTATTTTTAATKAAPSVSASKSAPAINVPPTKSVAKSTVIKSAPPSTVLPRKGSKTSKNKGTTPTTTTAATKTAPSVSGTATTGASTISSPVTKVPLTKAPASSTVTTSAPPPTTLSRSGSKNYKKKATTATTAATKTAPSASAPPVKAPSGEAPPLPPRPSSHAATSSLPKKANSKNTASKRTVAKSTIFKLTTCENRASKDTVTAFECFSSNDTTYKENASKGITLKSTTYTSSKETVTHFESQVSNASGSNASSSKASSSNASSSNVSGSIASGYESNVTNGITFKSSTFNAIASAITATSTVERRASNEICTSYTFPLETSKTILCRHPIYNCNASKDIAASESRASSTSSKAKVSSEIIFKRTTYKAIASKNAFTDLEATASTETAWNPDASHNTFTVF
ncbi:hypothetical protein HUJ05_012097 [Dendroctonus ponderosae]|nr:hypothetical protein HUJ05_012097 [Dendroctonus ponderosae]